MFDKQPKEWHAVKVEDVAAPDKYACVGGPFGSNLTRKDYVDTPGIPVSRGSNLTLGERLFKDDDFVFVSEDKAISLIQNTAYPGDIVFTQRGTIGQVALIPKNSRFPKYILSQNQMKFTPDPTKADVNFLLYYFLSPIAQEIILRNSIGSTIPGFNLTQLRKFPVPLPPLPEQKAIAQILGSLDDKIELNRQMNQTLEAMAKAIFKSWFVNFDPVRAKMEGRQPAGMDAATAELFPAEFEESALGLIPKGWDEVPFEELFLIPLRNGLTKPKAVRGNGTYMVNMGELFAYRRIGDIKMDRVPLTESEAEKSLLQTGDILFARQSLTLEGAGQSSIVIEAKEARTFESHLIRCRLNPKKAVSWFYFYYLQSNKGRGKIWSLVEQVAAAGIRGSDLAKLKFLAPPIEIQRCFGAAVESLEKKIASNDGESRTLASIRDTLLPKLLSGEIRVKEAEKLVEEVV